MSPGGPAPASGGGRPGPGERRPAFERLAATGPEGATAARALERVAAALRQGAVLAHPTSTVYGLGALGPGGDRAIARLKERDPERPLLRLAASVEALRTARPELAWDERAERLARRFWPGGLTLVLEDGSGMGLGVRVEAHPVTRALLERLGAATLSSTSLNRTGTEPARTSAEVEAFLGSAPDAGRPVLFLDAGDLPASSPSTVVSLVERPARLLRAGAVPPEEVARVLDGELST